MDFENKNNTYKIVMCVLVTAMITFLATAIGMYNYYTKTESGKETILETTATSKLDQKIESIRLYLDENYLNEIPDDETLNEMAVKGYVAGLGDEYTEYLTQDEYQELMTTVIGNYVGIGIYMAQDRDGNVIVLLPIEDSPAEEAGLKTGDIIVKVDGEECSSMDLSLVASKVKGEEGTKVNLEIKRDEEIINKTIERRTVEINQIKSEIFENDIGYIKILSFDENCSEEFKTKLDELLNQKITSLIIDVRDNGGGIVNEAIKIADLFLEKNSGIMVQLDKEAKEIVTVAKDEKIIDPEINVVILTNENSASASEIFVGALKDNDVAKTVGTKTFGKGVMQEIAQMKSGGALKVTVQEFRTPNGDIINKAGIKPDAEIEDDEETKEVDEQLQRAIEMCK